MPNGRTRKRDRNVCVPTARTFVEEIFYEWRTAANPCRVVTPNLPESIKIETDRSFNRVLDGPAEDCIWNVIITTRGERLWQVGLAGSGPKERFTLERVRSDFDESGFHRITEWQDITFVQQSPNGPVLYSPFPRTYYLTIHLAITEYRTYSGYLFLDFGSRPVVLQRICADCVRPGDQLRLFYATKNQLSLVADRWTAEKVDYFPYKPPFIGWAYLKERNVAIHPCPNETNFMLTSATLIEKDLTIANYRQRFHELIALEEIAMYDQIARYNSVGHLRLFREILKDGVLISEPGELFGMMWLGRELSEDTKSGRLFLMNCNKALVFFLGQQNDKSDSTMENPVGVFELHIEQKNLDTIYLKLPKFCVEKLRLEHESYVSVQVQFVLDRAPLCDYHKAVDTFPDLKRLFVQDSSVPSILDILASNNARFAEEWDSELLDACLNDEQKRAVAVMTAPLTEPPLPPVLVLGPFGTGKTFTIAHALRMLLMKNPQHRILLCTHSNSAADLYVTDFFHGWYKRDRERYKRLRPTRVYYRARNGKTVDPMVQEYCLTDHTGAFRSPTEYDLRDCGLIVTTLAMSAALSSLNFNPTHIVIDEAAQALECEVLIPLTTATPETRIIFAGDQMQLAPEIFSDLARTCGLGLTILERIFQAYPVNHPCRIQLKQNYRAHRDIVAFTSEVFYKTDIEPAAKTTPDDPYFKPLSFFAVPRTDVLHNGNAGYVNLKESKALAEQVEKLRDNWPMDRWGPYSAGSIGVLAPYSEQVRMIRRELRDRNLSEVSVERVRNAQGKQFTVVFISTVRNIDNCCRYSAEKNVRDYGFLTNPRLVNTAITRAKCLVAVFGDPIALLTIGSCQKLWKRYLEVASLHGINWQTIWHKTAAIESSFVSGAELSPSAQEFYPKSLMRPCIHNPRGFPNSTSTGTCNQR